MTDADTLHVPQAVSRGYIACEPWGVFDMSYPKSKLRRARVQGNGHVASALSCSSGMAVYMLYEL